MSPTQAKTVEDGLEVNLGVRAALRAWPLGFDLNTGLHFRLTGGTGHTDATGLARVPIPC